MDLVQHVWITGIGTSNPLGNSFRETASALLAGRSAVSQIRHFDTSKQNSRIAGLIGSIPTPEGWSDSDFAKLERMDRLATWCAIEALRDSGWSGRYAEQRVGVVLGNGGEWMRLWESDANAGGTRVIDPSQDRVTTAQALRTRLGFSGPAVTVAAACASGNYALAEARKWIQRGWADICIAGAIDLTVSPLGLASFDNLRALSTKRNDAPQHASRPFDKDRDGFVMSEGGVLFVLESERSARARGARGYAEIAGFGASSDAFHLVIPSSDPQPMANAMRQALADARLAADEIDYINAHATSTPVGDVGESRAIGLTLGDSVSRVPVSSTKGMSGHLICAAAALETIACIAAFENQMIPPTINLEDIDPDCAALFHVANQAVERPVRIALNNSFGFGGSNTCMVLRRIG
jgi:3-oxoacyl-[acyl-carrier-protein] synthase II